MASKNTSNQTCENENDNQWPRFLIMEAADEKVPLNLNAFVLKKAIDGMANAELDNVKPMKSGSVFIEVETKHDVQFSCAINQPLLAHHWRVHQCLLTSRFIALSIPWGVSAPGGKMLKKFLKDHNFLNNSPIFIIESSTFYIFAFQKALHTIHFNLKSCFGFGERYLTP